MTSNEIFFELLKVGDKRTNNWPLMENIYPILYILGAYLFIVKIGGPYFMKNRKAYDLKRIIQFYNLFQVVSCALLIYGIVKTGKYGVGCIPVDYSDNPMAVRIAGIIWWTMMLKMCELIETVFFVLRKKFNQVSNLHLYHHMSTLLLAWVTVKYLAGGVVTFPVILNSFIHIIMYIYYFLATLGPEWQKRLSKWKNKLTMMQMVQFCILVIHALQAFKSDCDVPSLAALIFIPNVLLVFYMFYDFYKKNYNRKTK